MFSKVFLGFPVISLVFLLFSTLIQPESTHLDLEKMFLLSDSIENLNFNGKTEISEPAKIQKNSGEGGPIDFLFLFVGLLQGWTVRFSPFLFSSRLASVPPCGASLSVLVTRPCCPLFPCISTGSFFSQKHAAQAALLDKAF